jgi:carbonic anhydrase
MNWPMILPQLEPCEHDLPADEFGSSLQLLADFGQGVQPVAVMLTCWELGFAPDEVATASPGDIMIVQNPGGLVPAAETENGGSSLASVMYGLDHATVRHLIVCGHTNCGTLRLLLKEETRRTENPLGGLMRSVKERFQSTYDDRPARDWLAIIVQETILQQLANLRSHAEIQSRLRSGKLLLHGWVRVDETSVIKTYDPAVGQFCD